MGASRVFGALGAILLVGGCSEFWSSNFTESRHLRHGSTIITNADVRLVHRFTGSEEVPAFDRAGNPVTLPRVTTLPDGTVRNDHQQIYARQPRDYLCAEPSPDIAKAVQASISGSAAIAATITPPSGGTAGEGQAAAQLNASRSESMAQLTKRIATVQLLRDGLYRACEAYANGAIGPEIYTAIISRYDRMMITMLLAEMAVGNFGSAAILSGNSSSEASADASAGAGGRALIAQRELEEADRQVAEQQIVVNRLNTEKITADQAAANVPTADPGSKALKDAAALKTAEWQGATDILNLRKATQARAVAADTAAKAAAQTATEVASARGRSSASSEGRIVDSPARAAKDTAEVLARMQRTYMNEPQGHSLLLMCFSEMASTQNIRSAMRKTCEGLFASATSPATQGLRWDTTARQQLAELDNDRINALAAKLTPAQASALLAKLLQNQATPSGLPTRPNRWDTASPHPAPR